MSRLHASSRARRNPSPFRVGDRVRCKHYAPDSFGTVRGFSAHMNGWVAVEFDLRPFTTGDGPEMLHSTDLEHVSPLEELAAAGQGRKGKKNPEGRPPPGNRVLVVGDHTGRKGCYGTIRAWSGNQAIVDLDVPWEGLHWYTEREIRVVTPIEELAALGKAKKNPKMLTEPDDPGYEIGEQVRLKYNGKIAKVLHKRPWSVYLVGFEDETGRRGVEVSYENMEKLTPIEQLALLGKAKKNPARFEPGTRVRVDNRPLRGTVLRTYEEFVVVRFDSGEEGWITPERLVILSPLEELARLAREPKGTKKLKPRVRKNPVVWKAEVGDRVKVERFHGYNIGTMTKKLPGGWCLVQLDKGGMEELCTPESVSRIGPLEELARLGKEESSRTKKNPRFAVGDTVHVRFPGGRTT